MMLDILEQTGSFLLTDLPSYDPVREITLNNIRQRAEEIPVNRNGSMALNGTHIEIDTCSSAGAAHDSTKVTVCAYFISTLKTDMKTYI